MKEQDKILKTYNTLKAKYFLNKILVPLIIKNVLNEKNQEDSVIFDKENLNKNN